MNPPPPPPAAPAVLAVEELATAHQLTTLHAALRARGLERHDAGWVVARPEDVAAALTCPDLSVVPGAPPADDAAELQVRMARFSDGPDHARRRAVLDALLPPVAGLEAAAADRTTALLDGSVASLLDGSVASFDAMPVARAVPVAVLATALGVGTSDDDHLSRLIGTLCDALAPATDRAPARPGGGAAAARELQAVLAAHGGDAEQVVAVASLLFQARDATAALIGASLLAAGADPAAEPGAVVERVLRRDAPVQCTRRTATADVRLGGTTVPTGSPVWVVLAAAEVGPPAAPATFGAGPHACPGPSHAVALASGVLAAFSRARLRAVPGQPLGYEPRPNLRTPSRVLMERW